MKLLYTRSRAGEFSVAPGIARALRNKKRPVHDERVTYLIYAPARRTRIHSSCAYACVCIRHKSLVIENILKFPVIVRHIAYKKQTGSIRATTRWDSSFFFRGEQNVKLKSQRGWRGIEVLRCAGLC